MISPLSSNPRTVDALFGNDGAIGLGIAPSFPKPRSTEA